MNIDFKIEGLEGLFDKLQSATKDIVIRRSLKTSGDLLANWSRKNRLNGPRPQFLGVRTGRLRASIVANNPDKSGNVYSVKVGTNVKYGKFHEFGAIDITVGKNFSSVRRVLPARPFLRPAIEDKQNRQQILDTFLININEAMRK